MTALFVDEFQRQETRYLNDRRSFRLRETAGGEDAASTAGQEAGATL